MFELDLNLGYQFVNPKDYNDYMESTYQIKKSNASVSFGLSLMLFKSSFPVSIGVRTAAGGGKETALATYASAQYIYSRNSAQVGFRLYEGVEFYIGLIGGYGFNHNLKIEVLNSMGTPTKTWDEATISSYNAGVYLGYKQSNVLGGYLKAGGEVGYEFFEATDIKKGTDQAPFKKLDLTGPYLLAVVAYGM